MFAYLVGCLYLLSEIVHDITFFHNALSCSTEWAFWRNEKKSFGDQAQMQNFCWLCSHRKFKLSYNWYLMLPYYESNKNEIWMIFMSTPATGDKKDTNI